MVYSTVGILPPSSHSEQALVGPIKLYAGPRLLLLPPRLSPPSRPTRPSICRPHWLTGYDFACFRGRRSLARVNAWACADVRRVGCRSSCHHQLSHVYRLGHIPCSYYTDPSHWATLASHWSVALADRNGCVCISQKYLIYIDTVLPSVVPHDYVFTTKPEPAVASRAIASPICSTAASSTSLALASARLASARLASVALASVALASAVLASAALASAALASAALASAVLATVARLPSGFFCAAT